MGLFSAGFYADALTVLVALLRSERDEDRAYAARFASVCWIANAELDGIDDAIISPDAREAMRRYIGDAPVASLEEAWQSSRWLGPLERALNDVGSNAAPPASTGGEAFFFSAASFCGES